MSSTPVATHGQSYPAPRLSTWGKLWRYAVAIIVGFTSLLGIGVADAELRAPWETVLDLVIGIASIVVIRWRRRYPMLVALPLIILSPLSISGSVFALWAYVHLCTRRRPREIVIAGSMFIVAQVAAVWPLPLEPDPASLGVLLGWLIVIVASTGMTTAFGLYIGARRDLLASLRDRAETAEREQELMVLSGQAAERNRIAREMHDVLAHRMSLVSMHAGALAYRTDLSPEQTREIAQTIQENAHQSLTELRGVLGSLREGGEPAALPPAKPQPTLSDIDTLIDEARAAGMRLQVHRTLSDDPLPAQVGRHAYRIVQEALTNARKHAPHTKVSLEISGSPGAGLTILASNPIGRGGQVPGSRAGLLGLRERAQMTGGTITHGVNADGDFELKVWLPW